MKSSAARLTPKQEAFALKTSEGACFSAAYRSAYDADGMGDASIWVEAHRVVNHPKVRARIAALHAQAESERRLRKFVQEESILQALTHLAEHAGKVTARIRALELLGKHLGMFKRRVEVPAPDMRQEEAEAAVVESLKRFGLIGCDQPGAGDPVQTG